MDDNTENDFTDFMSTDYSTPVTATNSGNTLTDWIQGLTSVATSATGVLGALNANKTAATNAAATTAAANAAAQSSIVKYVVIAGALLLVVVLALMFLGRHK